MTEGPELIQDLQYERRRYRRKISEMQFAINGIAGWLALSLRKECYKEYRTAVEAILALETGKPDLDIREEEDSIEANPFGS